MIHFIKGNSIDSHTHTHTRTNGIFTHAVMYVSVLACHGLGFLVWGFPMSS